MLQGLDRHLGGYQALPWRHDQGYGRDLKSQECGANSLPMTPTSVARIPNSALRLSIRENSSILASLEATRSIYHDFGLTGLVF
jgi:hypothetical protein